MDTNEYKAIQSALTHLMQDSTIKSKSVLNSKEREAYKKAVRACKSAVSKYNPDRTYKDEGDGDE